MILRLLIGLHLSKLKRTYISSKCKSLKLKSKGSISSDQCISAMKFLENFDISGNGDYYDELMQCTQNGFTVNLEYCAPENRIVVAQQEERLVVLNIRNIDTGKYLTPDQIKELYPLLYSKMATLNPQSFIDIVNSSSTFDEVKEKTSHEVGFEGYVIQVGDVWFKMKNTWYCTLHLSKDNIMVPRRLFEAVINETTDDLKSLFIDDLYILQKISKAEDEYSKIYNHMVTSVTSFYEENKHLTRKDFAIKSQSVFKEGLGYFNLTMNLYQGKEPKFKEHLISYWKQLGINGEKEIED